MTTPEQVLVKKRLRLLEEETQVQSTLELLRREDTWVKSFISRLAKAIGNIGK
jgi:hypothetical protein